MTRFIALALSVVMSLSMTSASAKPEPKNTEISTVAAVGNYTTRFARIGAPILPYGPLIVNYLDDIIGKYVERVQVEDGGGVIEGADEKETDENVVPKFYYNYTHGRWVFTKNGPKYVPFLIHPPMYRRWLDERFQNTVNSDDSNGGDVTLPNTGDDTQDKNDNKTEIDSTTDQSGEEAVEDNRQEVIYPETNPATQDIEETRPAEPVVEETKPAETQPATEPKEEPKETEPVVTEPTPTEPPVQETEPVVLPQTGEVVESPKKECSNHNLVLSDTEVNAEYNFYRSVTDHFVCSECEYKKNVVRDEAKELSASQISAYANEMVSYVNKARAEAGLSELWTSGEFNSHANVRANEQIERYGHIRPDGSTFAYSNGSCYTIGENTSAGYSSVYGFFNAFMNSSGHRGYIMYEEAVGIAVSFAVAEDGTSYCVMHIICEY